MRLNAWWKDVIAPARTEADEPTSSRFLRFALVGASGYGVNLLTFSLLVGGARIAYPAAAAGSFTVAVSTNYLLNRSWTFRDARGPFLGQGSRFFVVSAASFLVSLAFLQMLVRLGFAELIAQSAAIAFALPLNFDGNRVWSFSASGRPSLEPAVASDRRRGI
jgi:putative flippase GtrA